MTRHATEARTRTMRAHVIRVHSLDGALPPVRRFAVLAPDSGEAMAALIAELGLCEVAEVTGEVLTPEAAAQLDLHPRRPVRL